MGVKGLKPVVTLTVTSLLSLLLYLLSPFVIVIELSGVQLGLKSCYCVISEPSKATFNHPFITFMLKGQNSVTQLQDFLGSTNTTPPTIFWSGNHLWKSSSLISLPLQSSHTPTSTLSLEYPPIPNKYLTIMKGLQQLILLWGDLFVMYSQIRWISSIQDDQTMDGISAGRVINTPPARKI